MHYFGRLLRTWLYRNWAWLALIVVLLVMLSVHNPLFIYVGLMVVFLVFPLILYYLWFVYALHPDCRASILTKQVEWTSGASPAGSRMTAPRPSPGVG